MNNPPDVTAWQQVERLKTRLERHFIDQKIDWMLRERQNRLKTIDIFKQRPKSGNGKTPFEKSKIHRVIGDDQ